MRKFVATCAFPIFPVQGNSWLWIALNTEHQNERGNSKSEICVPHSRVIRKVVSSIVEELPKDLAGPDCDEDAVVRMSDEHVGGGVDELACGQRVDADALHSDRAVKCPTRKLNTTW